MTTRTEYVDRITQQLGVPYVYGGTSIAGSPTPGLDCSGLVEAVAKSFSIDVPRTTEEQFASLAHVDAADVLPGDIAYYDVAGDPQTQPAHCGVVLVPGKTIIEAPHTGEKVKEAPLDIYPIMGYRRVPDLTNDEGKPPTQTTTNQEDEVNLPELSTTSPTTEARAIKAAQAILSDKFNHPVQCDGVFGPVTEAAIKDVQTFFGLTVDGVVGPATWSVLILI